MCSSTVLPACFYLGEIAAPGASSSPSKSLMHHAINSVQDEFRRLLAHHSQVDELLSQSCIERQIDGQTLPCQCALK